MKSKSDKKTRINRTNRFQLRSIEKRLMFSADSAFLPLADGITQSDQSSLVYDSNVAHDYSAVQADQVGLELVILDSDVSNIDKIISDLLLQSDRHLKFTFWIMMRKDCNKSVQYWRIIQTYRHYTYSLMDNPQN